MSRTGLQRNDRIEITGLLPKDPDPLPVGTTGTVAAVLNPGTDLEQVAVKWDIPRSLMLLPGDPFRVLPAAT